MVDVRAALEEDASLEFTFDRESDSTITGHATNGNGVEAGFSLALGDARLVKLPASAGTVIGSSDA